MAIREIIVHTLGELLDRCTPAEPDPVTGRRRDTGVYRGAFDAARPLLTSLDRLGGVDPPHTKAGLEAPVLRNFRRYSRPYVATTLSDWELLVAAQHHGAPTRLLDWSYSPLVAAHFATQSARGDRAPRAVWRLDWQRVHAAFGFPGVALLTEDLERLFGGDGSEPFTPWRLFDAPSDAPDFACLVEPPSLDARITAQSAAFTLCSDKTRPFDAFLAAHDLDDALTRFVIPVAETPRIRDQLDLVGFDERHLFPDLDGVAAMLQRYYG
ncbi:MAG TPA: FRG domain-containing protein [Gemmatimonadaceae bacterium]|nr:FRG domain-containing protein [Gemmatimonadaceae bacterium]